MSLIDFIAEKFIKSLKDADKGIRPFLIPGTISREKAYNLYYGESFTPQELLKMACYFLNSLCIGNNIAIYLEGGKIKNITNEIKETFLTYKFGARHITHELFKEFGIRRSERDKPYIVLCKFVLKLMEIYEEIIGHARESNSLRLKSLIEDIKESFGIIYVVPDFKGERTILSIPKLDNFLRNWLENRERKKLLQNFFTNINIFLYKVQSTARKRNAQLKVENMEKVLTNYMEIFLKTLIEHNTIHWQSLRGIIDILMSLSIEFDVPINLIFLRKFEEEC